MRRLSLPLLAAVLLLSTSVALAKTVDGSQGPNVLTGTDDADRLRGNGDG